MTSLWAPGSRGRRRGPPPRRMMNDAIVHNDEWCHCTAHTLYPLNVTVHPLNVTVYPLPDLPHEEAREVSGRRRGPRGVRLGFGRTVGSEKEAPNMLVNTVFCGWAVGQSDNATGR
jgi:hypothetical protein